jgi:hypothetical protein
MNFDPGTLIASIIVSGIGTVAFIYGKRQSRVPHMVAGVILCVFPYFVSNVILVGVITAAVLLGLFGAVRYLGV